MGLVDGEFAHLVPAGAAVNMDVNDVWGFHEVLRELLGRALEVLALDVLDILAVGVGLQKQETLTIFWIAEPLEVDAARLCIAGLGVPVDFIEESLCVFGLDVELYVDQNHAPILPAPCGFVIVADKPHGYGEIGVGKGRLS